MEQEFRLVSALEHREALIPLYEEYAAMLLETEPVCALSLQKQN